MTPLPKPYYDEGGITIYHGDAREIDWSRLDVILTDPPYGVGVPYDVHRDDGRGYEGGYWAWLEEQIEWMTAVAPLVVFTNRVKALGRIFGWDWIYCWNKPNAMSGLNQLPVMPHWEPIFAYGVTGRKDLPRGFDVFSFNPVRPDEDGHPCPKPVSLFVALTERFVLPGQTVLDPFMGSGTTLVAAKACGRRAIGAELSERYCEIAAKRLAQEVLDFGESIPV